ncbi:MAG: transposase [Luteolibacter sp.]|uniref:IS66 family transposase n=1 Tax=Luteolibacter sp. TaxID=1962973 RepID=UPI003264DAE0
MTRHFQPAACAVAGFRAAGCQLFGTSSPVVVVDGICPVFVSIADRDAAPVPPQAPAAPGLLTHTLVSKYCNHLPFYRQEKIISTRHRVDVGRNTLCRWAELAAFWLQPIYQRIHSRLIAGDYLQADETPVKYLAPGTGKTG